MDMEEKVEEVASITGLPWHVWPAEPHQNKDKHRNPVVHSLFILTMMHLKSRRDVSHRFRRCCYRKGHGNCDVNFTAQGIEPHGQ